jgi:hypothetical protein
MKKTKKPYKTRKTFSLRTEVINWLIEETYKRGSLNVSETADNFLYSIMRGGK